MSLHITYDPRAQVVKTGTIFLFHHVSDDTQWGSTVAGYDMLLNALSSRWFFREAALKSVGRTFGFIGSAGTPETLMVSNRPYQVDPNADRYDERAYGSIFRNLSLFGSVLTGRSITAPSSVGENSVRHITYSGELVNKQQDVTYISYPLDFFGSTIDVRRTDSTLLCGATVVSTDPVTYSILDYGFGTVSMYSLDDLLNAIIGREFHHSHVHGYTILSDLNVNSSPERIVFSYHSTVHHSNGYLYEWDSKVVVNSQDHPLSTLPTLGATSVDESTATNTFEYSNCQSNDGYDGYGVTFGSVSDTRCAPCCLSIPPALTPVEMSDVFGVFVRLRSSEYLDNFRDAVRDSYDDILPSSMFSTVAAFQASESSLGTNVLQDLQKIPDICSALPKLQEAISVLGRLVRRDLSLATLREILSLATSTHLQASFQWRPFIDLVVRYLPQMIATFHALGHTSKRAVGYGSFRFKLTQQLGREEVILLTRSKIVMDTSSSGLLSAALGLDALGLLPKASNLWDLIPFTFVVNWFTGVGSALKRAEYSLLLATIPAYFVHSYTLTSPLSAAELDSLKMSSFGPRPASLRLYYRDVSHYSPYPRDSKFGFGIPMGVPNGGVLGSLLYQLIFG